MTCREIHLMGQLGPLMGYCDHQMRQQMAKMLRQYDVSPMQCRTLTFLHEAECEVNQRMLEKHLMVKPSTASGIVGRLEEKGLLRRQTSDRDGRCRILALTDSERQFYEQFRTIAQQVNQQAERGLSPQETETLLRLLLRVADNLSGTQEDAE